jgi:hypothetical protein
MIRNPAHGLHGLLSMSIGDPMQGMVAAFSRLVANLVGGADARIWV